MKVKNLIHEPKQVEGDTVLLTVAKIWKLASRGEMDFGGSEFKPSRKRRLYPVVPKSQKYGWWELKKGEYVIEYNEKVKGLVLPWRRLLENGCWHPASYSKGRARTLLLVGERGLRIKENARVSRAIEV